MTVREKEKEKQRKRERERQRERDREREIYIYIYIEARGTGQSPKHKTPTNRIAPLGGEQLQCLSKGKVGSSERLARLEPSPSSSERQGKEGSFPRHEAACSRDLRSEEKRGGIQWELTRRQHRIPSTLA